MGCRESNSLSDRFKRLGSYVSQGRVVNDLVDELDLSLNLPQECFPLVVHLPTLLSGSGLVNRDDSRLVITMNDVGISHAK